MKKLIQIFCILLSVIVLPACGDDTVVIDCIDENLINPIAVCTGHYEPVCGCDGQTYSNECVATYWKGVTRWVSGVCP